MKKQIVATLLGTALLLASASGGSAAMTTKLHPNAVSFSDLKGHFASEAVQHLAGYQMIGGGKIGGPEPSFAPESKTNRLELKMWIKNTLGKEVADSKPETDDVTRVEAATWIAASLPAMNTGINGDKVTAPYADIAGVTPEQRDALNLLYKTGIMVGDGQGRFNPSAVLTRGEAAAVLDRALNRSLGVAQKVEFEKVTGQLPDAVSKLADENREEPGLHTTVSGNDLYVLVCGGTVPTGGYSVTVDNVVETAAGIFVSASLQHPDPGQAVAMMVSYPITVLKIKNNDQTVYLAQ